MHANWLKMTTTSTGAGNLALTRVTGLPMPNETGISDGACVSYVLLDGSNNPIEYGIGTWTLSGAVLARTFPIATWVSGTWTNTGTAVTAATLSGTTTVLITEVAGSYEPAIRGHYNIASGFPSVQAAPDGCNAGSGTVTANKVYCMPYKHRSLKRIKAIGVYTGTVSGNLAFGIYRLNNSGYPDKLLVNSGTIAVTAARTVYTLPTPIWLPPDWYGVAVAVDNATASFGTAGTSAVCTSTPFGVDSTGSSVLALTLSQANITLPDPFTASAAGVNNPAMPRVNIDFQN